MTQTTAPITFHTRRPEATATATTDKARVLFIVPPYQVKPSAVSSKKGVRSFLAFPYGVLTLATYIQRNARALEDQVILDLNIPDTRDMGARIAEALDTHRPTLVAISLMFDVSYRHVTAISAQIKARAPETLIVMGGAVVTASYGEILAQQPHVDALCYSEGEQALCRLVDAADKSAALATNPWVTRQSLANGVVPSADYIEDLDVAVDIDYELVDVKAYSMKEAFSPFASYRNERNVKQFFIVTSRGCPFKCVFCAEPSYHGRAMRYASVDAVIAHVEDLVRTYGLNVLTIYDDQLLLDTDRAKELFRRLAAFDIRVEMPNGVTAVFIDAELAGLMKAAGVDTIFLALESGSEHVLKNIIKKPIRLDRIKPIIDNLHQNDIFVQAFFINGFPGESDEDRQQTYDFIRSHNIDWSLFNYATPLRGTELYRQCVENGWIDDRHRGIGDVDMTDYIIRAPGIDPLRLEQHNYLMNLDVNFVHNYRMRIGDYATAIRCFEEVIDRHPTHAFAHYYLADAMQRAGGDAAAIRHHYDAYLSALHNDPTWVEHARHFGLPVQATALSA